MEVLFTHPVTVPVPDAPGYGVGAPMGWPVTVDDTVGAALIAAGVAVDGADWTPPPPDTSGEPPPDPPELPFALS